jgi:hypothetical protein
VVAEKFKNKHLPPITDPCDKSEQSKMGSGPWGILDHSDFAKDGPPNVWNNMFVTQHSMSVSWDCCGGCSGQPEGCPKPSGPSCVPGNTGI